MKYNEEFFGFGKTKILLPNGEILKIDNDLYKNKFDSISKDDLNKITKSILDIVNKDLSGGWVIESTEIETSYPIWIGRQESIKDVKNLFFVKVSLKKEDLKINLIYKHPNSMSGPNNIIYYEVILNGQNVQNISIIDLDRLGIEKSGNGLIILNKSIEYTTNTPIERDEITLPNIVKIKKIISEKMVKLQKREN